MSQSQNPSPSQPKEPDNTPPALYRLDAIRSDGLTFMECVGAAMEIPELIQQFDRLWNANLMRKGLPLELAIDDACGRTDYDCRRFLNFLWEYVFTRVEKIELPPDKAAELKALLEENKGKFTVLEFR